MTPHNGLIRLLARLLLSFVLLEFMLAIVPYKTTPEAGCFYNLDNLE